MKTKAQLEQRLADATDTIYSLENDADHATAEYNDLMEAQKTKFEKVDGLLQDLFIDAEYLGTNEKILTAIQNLKRQVSQMAETSD